MEVQADSDKSREDAAARALENLRFEPVKKLNSIRLERLLLEGDDEQMLRCAIEATL